MNLRRRIGLFRLQMRDIWVLQFGLWVNFENKQKVGLVSNELARWWFLPIASDCDVA
jgi:hypothetical protein